MTAHTGIAVIGLGRMGQVYGYHVARAIPGATLVAVADARPEATSAFAARVSGVTIANNYEEVLANPAVQAVIVATPTSTHREIVIAAAEAGKAIFCEKPTALTMADTDAMLAVIARTGVMFQVGFMRRFDAGCAAAKRQIEAGVIGTPVTIRSIGRDPHRTSLEYADPAISGGLIVDMGIHDFDLVRWYMGDEIERVHTEVAALVYPELGTVGDVDTAMINLKFSRGGVGNIEVSRTALYGYDIQCTIIGTGGTLQVGYLQHTPLLTLTRQGVLHDVVPAFPQRFGAAYTAQIEHFVECLKQDQAPAVSAADARAALQASIAATVSQREGRIVYVNEI
ncbi:MAG: Gfo/Idh/MocA family oxidoreductase [Anaerolineae bacterium]|jgi:inositol 2-dehydrogenase|nr:Gfo/Idh/MocA family oxidoreductase [Anaerolineae bacterium]